MDRERIDALWLRRLSGETLSSGEEAELLNALKENPRLLDDLRADERIEGLLRLAGRTRADEARFLRRFESRVAAEDDGGRFVERIDARLRSANPWRVPMIAAAAILALAAIVIFRPRAPEPEATVQAPPRRIDPAPKPVPPPPPRREEPMPPKKTGED